MTVCRKNLYHAQKLQKQVHGKNVKPKSYAFGDKIELNSKYIKTKQNRKLKAKFFGSFQVLHLIDNQVYKLKYVSLLEHDTIKKRRVDETISLL